MKKDKVSREQYNSMVKLKDEVLQWYKNDNKYLIEKLSDYAKIQNENGYLKALFDKEGDTQVIKYNGKLYRIVSTTYCMGDGEETLDISLVPVSEVY